MKSATAASALRVQEHLGPDYTVLEFEKSTRSAADAAGAIGCEVAAIAKSLIFELDDGSPLLVIASGRNRVDEARITQLIGQSVHRPDADFVRRHTGFSIGGVPPVGHPQPLPVVLDEDLLNQPKIWAAAGTPNAVFRLSPEQLIELTNGRIAAVAVSQAAGS